MKKMTRKQRLYLIGMILCMITSDILICFKNNILVFLGYICFFFTGLIGIYFYREISQRDTKKLEK